MDELIFELGSLEPAWQIVPAVVEEADKSGVRLRFDGQSAGKKRYRQIQTSQTLVSGDHVLAVRISGTYIVLGRTGLDGGNVEEIGPVLAARLAAIAEEADRAVSEAEEARLAAEECRASAEQAISNINEEIDDISSVKYYDYENAEAIIIADGGTKSVIAFEKYQTRQDTRVEFVGHVTLTVNTTEDYDAATDTYTEHDGALTVTYVLDGVPVTNSTPEENLLDGPHMLPLLYMWRASGGISSRFEVQITCAGCSVTIDAGDSRGYLSGPGLVGDDAWDGSLRIDEGFMPIDFGGIQKYYTSEVEITSVTQEETGPTDSLAFRSFANTILKRLHSSVTADRLHRFTVLWNDDDVTKDGVHADGSYWVNDDVLHDGILTTPTKHVSTILKVTSRHTEQTGDVTYLASFDEGLTWYSYSGGWVLWESGHGMAEPVMHAITQAEWNSMLDGTITMRAILEGDTMVYDIQIYTEASE